MVRGFVDSSAFKTMRAVDDNTFALDLEITFSGNLLGQGNTVDQTLALDVRFLWTDLDSVAFVNKAVAAVVARAAALGYTSLSRVHVPSYNGVAVTVP